MFAKPVPEIDVNMLAEKLKSDEEFILLDVRELSELDSAKITDTRLEVAPMSRLGAQGPAALPESAQDKEAVIYVLCHHGSRSAQVTGWLASQGWKHVFSVDGGIAAYASHIDRSVGFY
jgi:rhodanese-related sulfurtransferase